MGEYLDIDSTFQALSDPTRRAIIGQLMNGPARVTELAQPHDISLNSVSKHLKILEKSNLIRREIKGREHWIRFNREPLAAARDWADEMLGFWTARLDALEALVLADNSKEKKDA